MEEDLREDIPNKDLIDRFLQKLYRFNDEERAKIAAAAIYASRKHGLQRRKTGEPYITHPIAVAEILIGLGMDADAIVAALLHDTLEDTDATEEEIASTFGKEVSDMVQAVTKISKITHDKSIQEAETIKKMFFAMGKDLRVIIIKLADKLHNMRTIDGLSPERKRAFAEDCLDIFAPIADSLGMQTLKSELEDLSLKALKKESYDYINGFLLEKKSEYNAFIKQVSKMIEDECKKAGITDIKISGRVKHAYSIYQKIKKRKKEIDEIFDILGIRIICKTTIECYTILGIIHSMWIPIEGRFKDYIAMPKANNYQSLHTTVLGPQSRHLEIQIRTEEMHKTAEEGVAAHWSYKMASGSETGTWKSMDSLNYAKIIKKIQSWSREIEQSEDFMDEIKNELLKDSIVVFTPQGHVIELPIGSTALDFAYKVHTEVGNHCSGAIADGNILPLNKELQNTQIVEILTSPSAHPTHQWLEYAKTNSAKKKIRAWLAKYASLNLPTAPKKEEKKEEKKKEEDKKPTPAQIVNGSLKFITKEPTGTIQIGEDTNIMHSFAKCCNPMKGDDVVAYITRGRGYIIHRKDCSNLKHMEGIKDRLVPVRWVGSDYSKILTVVAKMDADLFGEIDNAAKKHGAKLKKGRVDTDGNKLVGDFMIAAESEEALKKALSTIRTIPSVIKLTSKNEGEANTFDKKSKKPTPQVS